MYFTGNHFSLRLTIGNRPKTCFNNILRESYYDFTGIKMPHHLGEAQISEAKTKHKEKIQGPPLVKNLKKRRRKFERQISAV